MNVVITGKELRNALADIELAEKNGFKHCLAVLEMTGVGPCISQCTVKYSDMIEKGHPTDPTLNWGRFQGVTRKNRFVRGKLVRIKSNKENAI